MGEDKTSNNKPNFGLIGAIAAAIGASICCIGPLVLVGLGFSGMWIGSLSAFERYRPLFMLITFGFLAFAFYKVYFKSNKDSCTAGSCCANPKTEKIALWSVAVLVIGMLIVPSVIGAFASKPQTIIQTVPTKQIALNIEKMTCAACSVTVTKSLERIEGVKQASVTFTPPEAIIIYDPAKVSPKQLMEATTNIGYPSSIKGDQ